MATIQYEVPNNVQRMTIGVQGENNVREFLFDVTEWRQITGNIGAAEMVIQRRGDTSPYAAAITMHDENTVSWIPLSADTEKAGAGKIQLMWIANGQTVKTKIFDMKVDPALDYQLPDDSLDPWASWVPDVINAAAAMGDLPGTVADAAAEWLDENIGPTTPAVDASLSVAGAAADAKVAGDRVDELKSALDTNVLHVVQGKNLYNPALNQSGRMYVVNVGSQQTVTTSPTQVYQKMPVKVGNSYAISNISRAVLTDANDIVVENETVTNLSCIIQSVPNGVAYLWIETAASYAETATQVEKGTTVTAYEPYGTGAYVEYGDTKLFETDEIENIKREIEVSGYFKNITGFDGVQTFDEYVNASGGFVSGTGRVRTDYIPTAEGAEIIASLKGYSTFPIIAFYDSAKNFMSSVSILANQQIVVNYNGTAPSGVAYVVFASQTNYTGRSFTVGTPANLSETIDILSDDIYSYKGIKVLCMGDSLTAGRDGLGNILLHNYPYYMKESRLKDCIIDNKGVVGSTTVTYWNNNMSALTLDDTIDIVLMMWGTNGQLVRNTLATDVEPYNDYNDYADTGCGDFCKIIEYVMEHTQNSAQIILLTPPYNGSQSINDRVINAQPVVKAIGERYNLPVIDMFKCGIGKFNYTKFMPDDSVHFSEYGYKWIGTYIGSCVNALTAKRNT